jgi:ABC-2 type transport system permease protein
MGAVRDTWRMERLRLTSVRSSYLLVAVTLLVGLLVAVPLALLNPVRPLSGGATAAALTAGAPYLPLAPIGVLLACLSVLVVAHDYRYGLVRAVFTAQPRRSVLFGTRLALLGVLAGAVAVLNTLLAAAACWGLGRVPAHDPTTLRQLGLHVLLVVGWTWLGAGLAWLMRVTTGPLVVLLAMPLLVEPVLTALAQLDQLTWLRPVVRVLPFTCARELLSAETARPADGVGVVLGGALFAAYLAVVLLVGWVALTRRDS